MLNDDLLTFLADSPTSFQTVLNIKNILIKEGYQELKENETFKVSKGGKYFITRNGTSILAFNCGKRLNNPSFMIAASHSDCPSFKLKPNTLLLDENYIRLNTEVYGGPLMAPWFDRPLSLAGRLIYQEDAKIKSLPFDLKKDICLIPSLAIHMNREANSGFNLNPQVHLLPLCSQKAFVFKEYLEQEANLKKGSLLNYDLYLYPREKGRIWGLNNEFLSSQHLDNLECAYTSLVGFLKGYHEDNINVYACFDNEEVGSLTRQGAAGDFLNRNLKRLAKSLNIDYEQALGDSMLLSCDNGQASHPNHPEKDDPNNHCYLNKGLIIKFNANQAYTSDGLSAAIFTHLLETNNIAYQYYANRSDIRGGSTLGNLANMHLSLLSLDIGLCQLAMHSCYETSGSEDTLALTKAVEIYFKTHLRLLADNNFAIYN